MSCETDTGGGSSPLVADGGGKHYGRSDFCSFLIFSQLLAFSRWNQSLGEMKSLSQVPTDNSPRANIGTQAVCLHPDL